MRRQKLSLWRPIGASAPQSAEALFVNSSDGTVHAHQEVVHPHPHGSRSATEAQPGDVLAPATYTASPENGTSMAVTERRAAQDMPPVDLVNLLAGIAWFGEVLVSHVQRLWFPNSTNDMAWLFLREQMVHGLIKRRPWFERTKRSRNPIRRGHLYSLTSHALKELADNPQFPLKYLHRTSKALINHDIITTELIVKVIELGRVHGLSGIYVEREVRLDPLRPRPVMDAILVLRRGGVPLPHNRVPWTTDPRVAGERVRRYAIENDRDSESMAVIVAKAHAYQAAGTQAWLDAYGQFPVPMWIVPSEKRKAVIMQAWAQAWPNGKWLITTDAEVQQDRWLMYFKGEISERRLFD